MKYIHPGNKEGRAAGTNVQLNRFSPHFLSLICCSYANIIELLHSQLAGRCNTSLKIRSHPAMMTRYYFRTSACAKSVPDVVSKLLSWVHCWSYRKNSVTSDQKSPPSLLDMRQFGLSRRLFYSVDSNSSFFMTRFDTHSKGRVWILSDSSVTWNMPNHGL